MAKQTIDELNTFIFDRFHNYIINNTNYESIYQKIKTEGFMCRVYGRPTWSLLIMMTNKHNRIFLYILFDEVKNRFGTLGKGIIATMKRKIMYIVRADHYQEVSYRNQNPEDYESDTDFDSEFDEEFEYRSLNFKGLKMYYLKYIVEYSRDFSVMMLDSICEKRLTLLLQRAKTTILTLRKKTVLCDDIIKYISQYIHKNTYQIKQ